ncbi:hypothetical protein [Prevotella sp.]|nr:hypothetical protein [Prevotella sp.]
MVAAGDGPGAWQVGTYADAVSVLSAALLEETAEGAGLHEVPMGK